MVLQVPGQPISTGLATADPSAVPYVTLFSVQGQKVTCQSLNLMQPISSKNVITR